jgi:hypothetical protein
MPDYKEMYLTMMRETEKAINILIEAQRKCEEMYLRETDEENCAANIIDLTKHIQAANDE